MSWREFFGVCQALGPNDEARRSAGGAMSIEGAKSSVFTDEPYPGNSAGVAASSRPNALIAPARRSRPMDWDYTTVSHQPPANFCPLCRLPDQGGPHDWSEWRRTHDFVSSQRQAFMTEAADFFCPQCTSRYKLVRVRAEPPHATRTIHCKVCKESLPPTDGDYALKYFLVDKAKKDNGGDLRMKHSRGRPTAVQQQHQVQPKDGKL